MDADFDFKVPSSVPQDLLLIQDLIGAVPPPTVIPSHVLNSPDPSDDDSIASTDGEVESEAEVEADLAVRDEDGGTSMAASDSASHLDSESDTSSSDLEKECRFEASRQQRPVGDVEDEESGVTAAANYLQTKNEVVDANIMIPAISEVEPSDILEKVGEIMGIVGNIVIVKGLPADPVKTLSERALDAESLLVFEDRKVLGYIHETFGPTSQPLYQVKFNQHYPLDTGKVWPSRGVFHVPQQSHFVFVNQLKETRGSDASNIHDEEPAEDEIEFSDDEEEASFRARRRRRRGHTAFSSRQSTPATQIHTDDITQDAYHGSNPYDAHGLYDDDYLITGPSRPPPVPYDDPYADVPTPDARAVLEMNDELGQEYSCENGGDGRKTSRGRISNRGLRGNRGRNHRFQSTQRRGYHHSHVASQRMLDSDMDQRFLSTSQSVDYATGYEQTGGMTARHTPVQPPSETMNIQNYQAPFIQPHINPRFASMFGLNLQSEPTIPWSSQNTHDHGSQPRHWADTWMMHDGVGSRGEGDTYRPM